MKANELRIGNLVKCKISNDASIYTVMGLDGLHLRVYLNAPRDTFHDEDKIRPIHLTENWLIKLGFDDNGNKKWIHPKFGFLLIQSLRFYKSGVLPEIRYVHQLQNLYFALTGEELTVNN